MGCYPRGEEGSLRTPISIVIVALAVLAAGCSKPSSEELVHRIDGPLDARATVFSARRSTRDGQGWIAQKSIELTVTRAGEFLDVPPPPCTADERTTFELHVD